jgi:hypothetical protein
MVHDVREGRGDSVGVICMAGGGLVAAAASGGAAVVAVETEKKKNGSRLSGHTYRPRPWQQSGKARVVALAAEGAPGRPWKPSGVSPAPMPSAARR